MSVVRCCSPRPIGPRRTLASGSRSGPWRTLSTSSRSAAVNSSRRELLLSSTALVGGAAGAKAPVALAEGAESQAAPTAALELAPVPKIQLADDLEISRVIKGCWQLGGGHGGEPETDRTLGPAAVEDFPPFVEAGITTFDTADHYGPSEAVIGQYLYARPDHRGRVQVLTKFCCFGDMQRQAANLDFVEQCIDRSRQRLRMDKLDLLQFYWADYAIEGYVGAALHLAELQAQGKIRHIGVTNFDVPRLQEMLDAGVKIVSNQVQYSLLDRRPGVAMVDFCKERGIQLLTYGTVAGGFLSERYLGMDAREVVVNTYSKSKYGSVIGQAGGWGWLQELLQALSHIATKHGVSIADVATKWVLDQPTVAGVVVGARNALHVPDHQRMCSLVLDYGDLDSIQEVLEKGTQPTGDCYTWERGGRW
ncbi:hypothetical protein N2152v2_000822 [Parachlorella kessleri]